MGNEAQAQSTSAKAQASPFDRAVDASRAHRMQALEVARQMRVEARDQMNAARNARKYAALKNARLQKFVESCKELGIDISDEIEVPQRPANQSQSRKDETSNGSHPAKAD